MKHGRLNLPIVTVSDGPLADHSYESRAFLVFRDAAISSHYALAKRNVLEADVRVDALNGKRISHGTGGMVFGLDYLIMWWLWRANHVGIETADCDLDRFLDSNEINCHAVLWVYGVEPRETVHLTENIRIVPIVEFPDCGDKEAFLRKKWEHNPGISSVPSAALVADFTTNKIHPDSPTTDKAMHSCFCSLADVSLLLNVLPGVCCAPGYNTSFASDSVPFGPFGGRGGGWSIVDVLPKVRISSITSECVPPLQKLLDGFRKLTPSWNERISRSIARMRQSKCRFDLYDKALDLGIALEMVLLFSEHKGSELPGQLHNHFRTRGAWLLGTSFDERKRHYKALGKIYANRSQVAHSGVLKNGNSTDYSQTETIVEEHVTLAEGILTKLIVDGPPPDWAALVLGEGTRGGSNDV